MSKETSLVADYGGLSHSVAISGTSAQSATIDTRYAVVYLTTDAFYRQGPNPVALATGADEILPANTKLRIEVSPGNKLAFKTTGATGTVYITPGA